MKHIDQRSYSAEPKTSLSPLVRLALLVEGIMLATSACNSQVPLVTLYHFCHDVNKNGQCESTEASFAGQAVEFRGPHQELIGAGRTDFNGGIRFTSDNPDPMLRKPSFITSVRCPSTENFKQRVETVKPSAEVEINVAVSPECVVTSTTNQ